MSQAIERRIKKMEQVLVSTETHVIFIRFVAPDNLNDVKTELSLVGSDRGELCQQLKKLLKLQAEQLRR